MQNFCEEFLVIKESNLNVEAHALNLINCIKIMEVLKILDDYIN